MARSSSMSPAGLGYSSARYTTARIPRRSRARAARSTSAIAALRRRTPVELAENLFDHPDAGLRPREFKRRFTIQHAQSLPEPFVGPVGVAEDILSEGLDPGQSHQSIRFLDRERFLALSSVPAGAGRYDKSVDFAVGKAAALHRTNRLLRNTSQNELSEIRLGRNFCSKDALSPELSIDRFYDRFRLCHAWRRASGNIPKIYSAFCH